MYIKIIDKYDETRFNFFHLATFRSSKGVLSNNNAHCIIITGKQTPAINHLIIIFFNKKIKNNLLNTATD